MLWIAVAIGGALGSMARHAVNVVFARVTGAPTPLGTAAVNLVGSLVIGYLAGLIAAERLSMTTTMRTFVFVGILGGFTTFSSYMLDSLALMESSRQGAAALNLAGQLLAGLALVVVGYKLGLAHTGG
jgi:fluoride exporter